MKQLLLLCSILMFTSHSVRAQGLFIRSYLNMDGITKQTGNDETFSIMPLDSTRIVIQDITQGTQDTAYSSLAGKCNVELALGHQYRMFFSKEGFATKNIYVDAALPSDQSGKYNFPFEIILFKIIDEVNVTPLLAGPIASVVYSPLKMSFVYDFNHTNRINYQIRKMYFDYFRSVRRISAYDSAVFVPSEPILSEQDQLNNPAVKDTVIFRIQVCSVVYGPLPDNAPIFNGCGKADEFFTDGMYKYTVGEYSAPDDAEQRLTELRNLGYTDAFIVAYRNGQRITYEEGLALTTRRM